MRIVEPLIRLAEVEVVSLHRGPLYEIMYDSDDPAREGFPDWTPQQFIDFFCETFKVKPETEVTRIEWKYL
jgi:hypothetical protein